MSVLPATRSTGPFVIFAVRRTVPVTVPVIKVTGEEKTASVLFAGIVKFTVLVPFEKRVIGSSLGFSALEVKESTN